VKVRRAHTAAYAVSLVAPRLRLGWSVDVHADDPVANDAADFQTAPDGELEPAELHRFAVASEQVDDLASPHYSQKRKEPRAFWFL
jgi:hypothetical protein